MGAATIDKPFAARLESLSIVLGIEPGWPPTSTIKK